MPIYEYKCTKESCAVLQEVRVVWEERKDAIVCRYCGGRAELVTSRPSNPQFKGTGFHTTDYKGK